ncbi:dihydropteroate synthase [Arachidicoccus ginsenosidivorans]|uniref:dihydropteroate synthase n=1 Tax=Arachidicoccus ginsenosidivorans TaxID=496057 RepID=A0A5B8VLJ0_9BACT|nr:dihydropteroate synthase [Arachidicoccus ginsenosidivorans]QEC71825.1 dihydropteroate synthase [Arachidicoccus ginsenosidivorans]
MFTLNCKGRLLTLTKPIVMGIINVNDDSFYGGSRQIDPASVVGAAEAMLTEGASCIDIGGQSTHPKSPRISANEEAARVIPAIKALLKRFPEAVISIDTYYSEVAAAAVEAGALLVNDISAGGLDSNMFSTVSALEVPYIAMHMRGNPNTMASLTDYQDVVTSVFDYFVEKIGAIKEAGIKDLIIDPGFGFAKTEAQNYQLLARLSEFKLFDLPILVGVSRKSMIYKFLGISAEEALNGTTVLNTWALSHGADILRVHDVKAAMEAIRLMDLLDQRSL